MIRGQDSAGTQSAPIRAGTQSAPIRGSGSMPPGFFCINGTL